MTPRRAVNLLRLAAGGLLLVSIGLSVAALTLPLDLGPDATPVTAARPATRPVARTVLPTLEALEPLAAVPLRRPLHDAPPAALADADPPSLPPLLRLTGTIIEPGPPARSLAILSAGLTDVQLIPVGGTIVGAEVLAIRPDAVTLRYEGRVVELTLHKPIPVDDSGLDPVLPLPEPTPAAGTLLPK